MPRSGADGSATKRPACCRPCWSARRTASARPLAKLSASRATAWRGPGARLERADDGQALIGMVSSRATARLDGAALDLQRRNEALPLDAARRLTDAGVDLAGLGRTVEALGLDATLKRGFALATTLDGTLVPTRAAALAAGRVTLTFADGAVTAPRRRISQHRCNRRSSMTTKTITAIPTPAATYASAYAALAAIAERLRGAGTASTIDTLAEGRSYRKIQL